MQNNTLYKVLYKNPIFVNVKFCGQTISKANYGVLNSPKKTNAGIIFSKNKVLAKNVFIVFGFGQRRG